MKFANGMTGKLLLTLLVLVVALAGIAQALTISGALKLKNSTATPGVTKARVDAYGPNGGRAFGTYVTFNNASSASYSIKGVDTGTVSDVRAHVDTHSDLLRHPLAASGISPIINGTTANLELTGSSPALPVQPPAGAYVLACDQTALLAWESLSGQFGFADAMADSYNVYWSANQLGGLASWKALPEGQKRSGIKPAEPTNTIVRGLTNGSGYYFAITAVINGNESEPYVSERVTIGKPTAGNFTATIDLAGLATPTDTVYAMLTPEDGPPVAIGTALAGAGSSVQLTIPLPELAGGVYYLHAFIDKQPDSSFGLGDYKTMEGPNSAVTITNNSGSGNVTLSNLSAELELNSDHWKNSDPANGFEGYGLYFGGGSHTKLPVAINVTGANLPAGGIDLGIDQNLDLWMGTFVDFGPIPPSGNYTFNVTYSDGTGQSTAKTPTVLTNFPTAISPSGSVDPFNQAPTFNWSAPSSPAPAPVAYSVMLMQNGFMLWQQETPGNATSLTYPSLNVPQLQDNNSYSWGISAVDGFGNRITRWTDFNFGAGGGTPADNQAPTVPTNVTATAVSSSRIDISWTTSTDNVGVSYYQVYRNGQPAGTPGGQDNNYWWDDNLNPGTTYNYTVAACDAAGNCSAPSSPTASATTPPAASPSSTSIVLASGTNPAFYGDPLTFTATVSPSDATGTIQFKVNGVNSGSPVNLVGGSATSASLSSMTPGAFSVTAAYSGSGSYLASTSAPLSHTFKYAVKIGAQPYQTLTSAFAAGGLIQAREMLFNEAAPISILLPTNFKGGYSDDGFSNNAGKFTILARPLTIQTGSLTVEGLAIR